MSRKRIELEDSQEEIREVRRPGQGAREMQQQLAKDAPIKTFFTRLFGIHTDERAWRLGAEGEEQVGALLEGLRPHGWAVEHDVTIGQKGANVDHLVIGPPGVFVINTKLVSADVWVSGPVVKVGAFRTDFVEKLEAEAMRVRKKLLAATGQRALWVQGLLVFVRPTLRVKRQPRHVAVLADRELVPRLLQQEVTLGHDEVAALARAARVDSTWR
ncbi:NERD domain-containing protein [Corallococcus exercitus]|uniref:NERD domain-containing protein n=1 Tax=Corallococcus exercitus TaxID=2316736 RepID=A0A7Y4KGC6_9BACT|nr:nuclease-related domain-containing protein [Corallococcus exercitus]NOK32369.1 NERD domain-containing protein [Corallococcus exercitus]